MDIEPAAPESNLDDVFPIWDELFAAASDAHERVKAIQSKLKQIATASRDPNREALQKEMEAAVLRVQELAARVKRFCEHRDFSSPEQ